MPQKLFYIALLQTLCLTTAMISCKTKERFDKLGTKLAGPIDVGVSEDGSRFYVLNGDFDRTYNKGSILMFDEDGNRLGAVPTLRLGRSMDIAGNDMIISYNPTEEDGLGAVDVYDISDSSAPILKKRFPIECSPLKAAVRKNYQYFVVSCAGGRFYIGTLAADRTQSTLKLVRDYGPHNRRAVYLDSNQEMFFAFVTDMGEQTTQDFELTDRLQFDPTVDPNNLIDGANGVPDDYEVTEKARRRRALRRRYMFAAYDIAEQAALGFPYFGVSPDGSKEVDQTVEREFRFLYFTLSNLPPDHTPDAEYNPDTKRFTTNFRKAMADPFDSNSFLISQRSPPNNQYLFSNNVIRATFVGNPRIQGDTVPDLDSYLKFERIYGFRGEIIEYLPVHSPGDFEVEEVDGEQVLVVNHFRDRNAFDREDYYYAIAAKTLDNGWTKEMGSQDPKSSFYQVAINKNGRALTTLFYDNSLILLDVKPGAAITVAKQISD